MGHSHTAFRPWFWNLVLAAVTVTLTAFLVGIVVTEEAPVAKAVYALLAVTSAVMTVRAVGQRVVVRPEGITMHEVFRTRRIPWDAVADVTYEPAGERLWLPTWAPVVLLRHPLRDGGPTRIPLEVVRSFRSRTPGQTMAERAVHEIRRRLAGR